jgi:hypothetical protein
VLACPGCGGRLRLLATIAHPPAITKILRHLGLPAEVPRPVPGFRSRPGFAFLLRRVDFAPMPCSCSCAYS